MYLYRAGAVRRRPGIGRGVIPSWGTKGDSGAAFRRIFFESWEMMRLFPVFFCAFRGDVPVGHGAAAGHEESFHLCIEGKM